MGKEVKIPRLLELQLMMLAEGRPFLVIRELGEEVFQLDHENGLHHIQIKLSQLLPPDGKAAKMNMEAMIRNLDAVAYPARSARTHGIAEELARELMESAPCL